MSIDTEDREMAGRLRDHLSRAAAEAPLPTPEWGGVSVTAAVVPPAPSWSERGRFALVAAALLAAFGLGALTTLVVGDGPDRSMATSPSSPDAPPVTLPLPDEAAMVPLALLDEADWPEDIEAWTLGPVRLGSTRVFEAADRTVVVVDGIWQWQFSLETARCVTAGPATEWDCRPLVEPDPDIRFVGSARAEGDVAGLGPGGTAEMWTPASGPGTWVWDEVPADTAYVALDVQGEMRWQRPVDGVAVFPQGDETAARFVAVDADGVVMEQDARRAGFDAQYATTSDRSSLPPGTERPRVEAAALAELSESVVARFVDCVSLVAVDTAQWQRCADETNLQTLGELDQLTGGVAALDPVVDVRVGAYLWPNLDGGITEAPLLPGQRTRQVVVRELVPATGASVATESDPVDASDDEFEVTLTEVHWPFD